MLLLDLAQNPNETLASQPPSIVIAMNDKATTGAILERAEIIDILRHLPHRYPFVMIDRIVDMRRDEFAIGIKNLSFNEWYFEGHFPNDPLLPGVLQIEGMAQTAVALVMFDRQVIGSTQEVFFTTINKARFLRPVRPGETIEYHVTKTARRFNVWKCRAEAIVDDTVVAEAQLGALMADRG